MRIFSLGRKSKILVKNKSVYTYQKGGTNLLVERS